MLKQFVASLLALLRRNFMIPLAVVRLFRRYHRWLALVLALPLLLTLLTGMLASLPSAWLSPIGITHHLLLDLHTGAVFPLGRIYPLLNGLGLLGLLVTGVIMLVGTRRNQSKIDRAAT
jgi:hypothetical protein